VPAFVQIIEFTSSRIDEIQALTDKMRAERGEEGPGPVRARFTEDRDQPGHFLSIVEFASYEAAMANSEHPATQEYAARMAELVDSPPRFYNLDVRDGFDR
jgi:quinol monooxygenase YgiN